MCSGPDFIGAAFPAAQTGVPNQVRFCPHISDRDGASASMPKLKIVVGNTGSGRQPL